MMTKIAKAEREYDLNSAAVLKYGELPELQKQLVAEEELYSAKGEKQETTERMLNDTVLEDDIAAIVSTWTGIPVSKLLEGEMQKLLKLQEELDKKVIGQKDATKVQLTAYEISAIQNYSAICTTAPFLSLIYQFFFFSVGCSRGHTEIQSRHV